MKLRFNRHIRAHAATAWLGRARWEPAFVAVVASGGPRGADFVRSTALGPDARMIIDAEFREVDAPPHSGWRGAAERLVAWLRGLARR
jgi:hypothetical protein